MDRQLSTANIALVDIIAQVKKLAVMLKFYLFQQVYFMNSENRSGLRSQARRVWPGPAVFK